MSKLKIYHNPRCSKSRETLQLINNAQADVEIIDYQKASITKKELEDVLMKLNMTPEQIVRKDESLYKANYKDKKFGKEEWIQILIENPILIERPIVIKGNKAVLGRPPENVLELLKN